jgi:hypothetical protein
VRRQSNLNFLFRLSLKFYRLVSSSVARGSIPERSEASRRLHGLHGLAEIKQWNRSRTGNCGNEPSGDRPDGSFYCWAALAGAITPSRRCRSQCSHSIVVDAAPCGDEVRLSDLEPRFTYNAAAHSPRAELLTIRILIATEHGSIQALTEFHFRFGANR